MKFIPIQARPYLRLARRIVSGAGSISAMVHRQEVLCPEETTNIRPAIFLPDQLDRILAPTVSTKEKEIAAATATTVTHQATVAHHFKDAVLYDGSFYVKHWRHPISDKSLFSSLRSETNDLKTAALASSYLGGIYFGHWLVDDCAKYLLAETFSEPLCIRGPLFGDRRQYQAFFGQEWTTTDRAHIDDLVIFEDVAPNSHKLKRFKALRDRLATRFPRSQSRKQIYLRRGQTGAARPIENEDEIVNELAKRGFIIIDIAANTLAEILAALSDARVVVSIEGSQVMHCTFASPENCGILVLQPPDRFSVLHRSWSEPLGMRFGFVVGHMAPAGYRFSPSEILQMADLMLKDTETIAEH